MYDPPNCQSIVFKLIVSLKNKYEQMADTFLSNRFDIVNWCSSNVDINGV